MGSAILLVAGDKVRAVGQVVPDGDSLCESPDLTRTDAGQRGAGVAPVLLWGVIVLELTRNGGAAFSVGQRYTAFIALVAICAVYGIIRFSRKSSSKLFSISLGLILGGATGNLIDRLARAPGVFDGHVVDWIHIAFLPFVFNLADAAITIGAVLLVLTLLNGGRELAPLEPED